MTPAELAASTGATLARATAFLPAIDAAAQEFDINTTPRLCAFLAQIGHESGGLHFTAEIWGPTQSQSRYEGRYDLGNNEPGDGYRFRGRGLIQITGRANYKACGDALGLDLIEHPEKLSEPEPAARSAGWFWKKRGCNELADAGMFEMVTKRINGGLNGYAERLGLWERAKEAIA